MFVSPSMPTGGYNQDVWLEKGELSRRTSLIVDPPDGRLPPVTPAEQKSSERTRLILIRGRERLYQLRDLTHGRISTRTIGVLRVVCPA